MIKVPENPEFYIWPGEFDESKIPSLSVPVQTDLESLVEGSTALWLMDWLTAEERSQLPSSARPASRVLKRLKRLSSSEFGDLKLCLEIDGDPTLYGRFCASSGGPVLYFEPSGDALVVLFGQRLRWDTKWFGDARLVSNSALMNWLALHVVESSQKSKGSEYH